MQHFVSKFKSAAIPVLFSVKASCSLKQSMKDRAQGPPIRLVSALAD